MQLPFSNRTDELAALDAAAKAGGLLVVFGRRRIGKTRLLSRWLKQQRGIYSQAIEGSISQQVEQTYQDLQPHLTVKLQPRTWAELLEVLKTQGPRLRALCLDEFHYLVSSDPTLPSVLQRWLDHDQPPGSLLILCGSSVRMMNDLFRNRSAPLFGRARQILHIAPMSYEAFCQATNLRASEPESFVCFALVGGVPKYWEFIEPGQTSVQLAEALFFGFAPYLDQEPMRLLRDEGVAGLNAIAVLEAVGRGAAKPSEIAARLGTAQTNLTRLLLQLLDANILKRELPFGESSRTTKRVNYRIDDPALRFWFQVYSPHRSRWRDYSLAKKQELLQKHASSIFEDWCRSLYHDAARYWEAGLEFDMVRRNPAGDSNAAVVVSEIKWRRVSANEAANLQQELAAKWQRSALHTRYQHVTFEVLDASLLARSGVSAN